MGSQSTVWRGRELEPHSVDEGDRSSEPGSSGAAHVATTSPCSSSCSGATGCEWARLDGSFGPRTAAAVRRFQRRAGLTPDAMVGPRTTRRLCALAVCAWRAGSRATTPRLSVQGAIEYWSRTYGVDAHLVRAVALWESGYNNSLVSTAGARGVMQVTPATWDYVETVVVGRRIARTTSGNVHVGVAFLDRLLREFRGDVQLALAAYVQGPRSVRRHGLFRGTRQYVAGVLALSRRV